MKDAIINTTRRAAVATALAAGACVNAEAALIGVVQTFPDVTLAGGVYLMYDHDYVNATTGRLQVVSGSSTLKEAPADGGSTMAQTYFSGTDSTPDIMLTIDINNTTGALVGGNVSISTVNSPTASNPDSFKWLGTITEFGFQGGSGTIFDARWVVTEDTYTNMPATMSQFVNGFLTGDVGGLKLTSSNAAFNGVSGGTANFGNDWVFGTSPSAASLDPLETALFGSNAPPGVAYIVSTVTADVFVPIPAAAWLFSSGVAAIVPLVRRRSAMSGPTEAMS